MPQDTDVSTVLDEKSSADDIARVADAAAAEIATAGDLPALEAARIKFVGRSGAFTLLSKAIGKVAPDQRKAFGASANAGRQKVEAALEARKTELSSGANAAISERKFDVTFPGTRVGLGRHHPLTQTLELAKNTLIGMGYSFDDYPEVEVEYYNFDALNTPGWHPSRDMHDSFYTTSGNVLRTHTSAFQVRAMKAITDAGGKPPIRAMTAGRCYRRDEIDMTHYPMFHQIDVIAVDKGISMADLKWTLQTLLRAVLGDSVEIRFRPSYFPFTTPSAEVDVFYRGRWMELLGSGMMRPEVLRNGGIDPNEHQGFAFGMGIDRLTMARFGIDDIRLLYANEEPFLSQF
ncbi:MAG: phenylalanine--tRNA ligase subunit alpha [Tepidisphaeraceae bacterium]